MSGKERQDGEPPGRSGLQRREILGTVAAAGGAAVGGVLAAPYVGNAQMAAGISLKVQSLWSEGSAGLQIFRAWCDSMAERTAGELALVPFAAGDIVDVFEMSDAVAGGVLDGMHWNPIYWASTGRMPAGAFLSSFPMGLNHPHQWDMLFDSYGGTDLARELYAKQGMYFVGHVQHDLNLIYSRKPIRSLADFEGLKIRMPGGLIADCFTAIGARTFTLAPPRFLQRWRRGPSTPPIYTGRRSTTPWGWRKCATTSSWARPRPRVCISRSICWRSPSISRPGISCRII
jgi:TRAP-type mannitol/chloroaromatic compound transport system substrate-binding protein